MIENEFQNKVTNQIITENPEPIEAKLTDNENAVIIEAGEYDAAFTADEARELANGMELEHHQRGYGGKMMLVASDYIHDLADVVDGEQTADEVRQRWEDENI